MKPNKTVKRVPDIEAEIIFLDKIILTSLCSHIFYHING